MKKILYALLACVIVYPACNKTEKTVLPLILSGQSEMSGYTFFGGTGTEAADSVQQTKDGGYIVAGTASGDMPAVQGASPLNDFVANEDMIVMKLDSSGIIVWYTYLGGTGNDGAKSIQQTKDAGYILAGSSDAGITDLQGKSPLNDYESGNDMFVVKLDSSGNVDWYPFLGGTGVDNANSIRQTTDGGYIIGGESSAAISTLQGIAPLNGYTDNWDMLAIKLASSGNVSWYTFFGTINNDMVNSIQQTNDGGYIIGGYAGDNIPALQTKTPLNGYSGFSDPMVIKLDSYGAVTWYTFLGSPGIDGGECIRQTSDGGYIFVGSANDNIAILDGKTPINARTGAAPWQEILVIKLTSSGNVDWYTFLGGEQNDTISSVRQTRDGGYILAGNSGPITTLQGTHPLIEHKGSNEALVIKITASGNVDWFSFFGSATGMDFANDIQQTSDGGYIVAGASSEDIPSIQGLVPLNPYRDAHDILVIKLLSDGYVNHPGL